MIIGIILIVVLAEKYSQGLGSAGSSEGADFQPKLRGCQASPEICGPLVS